MKQLLIGDTFRLKDRDDFVRTLAFYVDDENRLYFVPSNHRFDEMSYQYPVEVGDKIGCAYFQDPAADFDFDEITSLKITPKMLIMNLTQGRHQTATKSASEFLIYFSSGIIALQSPIHKKITKARAAKQKALNQIVDESRFIKIMSGNNWMRKFTSTPGTYMSIADMIFYKSPGSGQGLRAKSYNLK